jgi:hypothetical protein
MKTKRTTTTLTCRKIAVIQIGIRWEPFTTAWNISLRSIPHRSFPSIPPPSFPLRINPLRPEVPNLSPTTTLRPLAAFIETIPLVSILQMPPFWTKTIPPHRTIPMKAMPMMRAASQPVSCRLYQRPNDAQQEQPHMRRRHNTSHCHCRRRRRHHFGETIASQLVDLHCHPQQRVVVVVPLHILRRILPSWRAFCARPRDHRPRPFHHRRRCHLRCP